MNHNTFFPKLKPSIKIRKRDNYAVLYGNHPSQLLIIHPSDAFILNFCTGKYSVHEIVYLFGETYSISKERALNEVEKIITNNKRLIDLNESANSNLNSFQEPKNLLFNVNEQEFEKVKENYFLSGLNLSLTLNCNFNCKYCYQSLNKLKEKLNLEKCLSLVEEASKMGMIYFGLTGGEPTLFKGWLQLVQKIIQYDMIPVITTNGNIIGSNPIIAQQLNEYGLQAITVSLDASNSDLHHNITNTTNTFNKVVNAIKYLLKNNIHVIIKYVLSSLNFADLENFIEFIVKTGVHEVGITNIEGGAIGSGANSIPQINKSQYNEVLTVIKKKTNQYKDICIIHPPDHNSCFLGVNDWFPCGGLSMGMSIFPNGDVTICDKLLGVKEFTYGNIFNDNLENIWHSNSLKLIRNKSIDKSEVGKDCSKCSKLPLCKTSCFVDSYNVYGNYFMKNPRCSGPFLNKKISFYSNSNYLQT